MTAVNADGRYAFAGSGVQPAFDPATYWGHETESEGSEDEGTVTDAQRIVTASGTFAYDTDWNNIERAARTTVDGSSGEAAAPPSETAHWHLSVVGDTFAIGRGLGARASLRAQHRPNV